MSDTHGSDPTSPAERLKELDRRLREREETRRAREGNRPHAAATGLGIAMRMSVELVAAFAVGGALGYGLDILFHTKPWIMVIGLMFGFAAGVRNAVRTAKELQATAPLGEDLAETDDDDG